MSDDAVRDKDVSFVQKCWREVLPNDDFPGLDEPMDSIKAETLLGEVEQRLGLETNSMIVNVTPTIREIVRAVRRIHRGPPGGRAPSG